jgi:probable HAF family extracellular repeat protein
VAGGINIFGPGNSFAYDANSNGTIAVGHSGEIASLWDLSGAPSQTPLGTLAGDNTSQAESVSADGTVVVGWSRNEATSSSRAFRWTFETGMTDLGRLNEDDTSTFAGFVSSNAQYILGGSFGGDGLTGFIWTELAGMTSVESYLLAGGVDLTDWSGIFASGITDDGRYLTGRGTYQGLEQGFVAEVVPEPSTYALLALAAAGLGAHVLRRRRK